MDLSRSFVFAIVTCTKASTQKLQDKDPGHQLLAGILAEPGSQAVEKEVYKLSFDFLASHLATAWTLANCTERCVAA